LGVGVCRGKGGEGAWVRRGLRLGVGVQGLGARDVFWGLRVWGWGFRVPDFGFWFWVLGFGLQVSGFGV